MALMTPMTPMAQMPPVVTVASRPTLLARLLVVPIVGYRKLVSPFLGQRCRFTPSCSAYAVDALRAHGAFRGLWLAIRRVARCHPWNPGGPDPVPPSGLTGLNTGAPRCIF